MDELKQAIENTKVITFSYTDKKGVGTQRKIEPYEIKGENLIGFDIDKNQYRMFKIENIQDINVTDQVYVVRTVTNEQSTD